MYLKNVAKKLLLIVEEGKQHNIVLKDFNTFMYDLFAVIFVQVSGTEEILKSDIKDCFKINGKQRIQMPKKGEYLRFKSF